MMDPTKEAAVWERVRAASAGERIPEKKAVLEKKSPQKCVVRRSGGKLRAGLPLIAAVALLVKRR